MYCKTITKGIFDSYIANDSDTVLEGVVTNTFGNTTFWRFVRVPLAKGEHIMSKPSTRRVPSLSLWLWA